MQTKDALFCLIVHVCSGSKAVY